MKEILFLCVFLILAICVVFIFKDYIKEYRWLSLCLIGVTLIWFGVSTNLMHTLLEEGAFTEGSVELRCSGCSSTYARVTFKSCPDCGADILTTGTIVVYESVDSNNFTLITGESALDIIRTDYENTQKASIAVGVIFALNVIVLFLLHQVDVKLESNLAKREELANNN